MDTTEVTPTGGADGDAVKPDTDADAVEPKSEVSTEDADAAAAAEPAKEGTGEDADGGDGETPKGDEPSEAEKAAAEEKKNRTQARIDEITRKRREAERDAADARAKQARLEERLALYEGDAPKSDDFDTEAEYQAALASHEAKKQSKAERELDVKDAKAEAQAAQKRAADAAWEAYDLKAAEMRDRVPDFDAKVNDPSVPFSDAMAEEIRVADRGPEIAYHLANNPDEARRLASIGNATELAREFGRMEARLDAQPAPKPKTTNAPDPVGSAVKASGSAKSFDPAEASVEEMQQRLKAKGVIS